MAAGDAHAGIADGDQHLAALAARRHPDLPCPLTELLGVGEERPQDLDQPGVVAVDLERLVAELHHQLDAAGADALGHLRERVADGQAHIEAGAAHGEPAALALGEIEEHLDELDEAVGVGARDLEPAPLSFGERPERAAPEEIVVPLDAHERRAQLVRDVGEELRLQAVERGQLLVALAQLGDGLLEALLQRIHRRHVAHHRFDHRHPAARVAHRVERLMQHARRAVLAPHADHGPLRLPFQTPPHGLFLGRLELGQHRSAQEARVGVQLLGGVAREAFDRVGDVEEVAGGHVEAGKGLGRILRLCVG